MKTTTITIALFLVALQPALGQEQIDYDFEHACNYYGEQITEDIYGFASTDEAVTIVQRIMDEVGLEPNFEIMAANVPNALATIRNSQRLILYSQNFILQIKNATGTDWAGISILAHEIGHHLNGHTIVPGGSRPTLELEADKFSGFVCAKMGSTLDEAQAAMNRIANDAGSPTHPPKSARLEAIASGWNQAKSSSIETDVPEDDFPGPANDPIVTTNGGTSSNTTSISINYSGDRYGCNLPVEITLGGKTFKPSGSSFVVHGIPKGRQVYTIEGKINCNSGGSCFALGSGELYITEGEKLYVQWQNSGFGRCKIWLKEVQ